ncbi:MAG: PHP domain-containing protein [Candidatus Heimdallarchaeaceae archaeon]
MINVDFHVHSKYSYDGTADIHEILNQAKKRNINVLCITDHDELVIKTGFYEDIYIIAGEEITTKQGEIIGLFLEAKIPKGIDLPEAIKKIKQQGGIVYLPHPFDVYRKGRIKLRDVLKNLDKIDIIEIHNGKYLTYFETFLSWLMATFLKKIKAVGSDAHKTSEIGLAYVCLEEIPKPDTILKLLRQNKGFKIGKSPLLPRILKKLFRRSNLL